MPKQRTAYFKTHKRAAQRKTFLARQKAKLQRLRRAAACTVESPPPPDTTAPTLAAATVNGATVTLAFDEELAATPAADQFAATVGGLAWKLTAAAATGKAVTLTLGLAADAGQAVSISYSGSALKDAAGNVVAAFTAQPTNTSPAGPSPAAGSFSPLLAKPSFADNHVVPEPWVGEWGPKSDPQWAPSTGHLHALLVPVDFPDVPSTRAANFYRDLVTSTTAPWYAESSYGRLAFDLTALDHWTRMSNPVDSYGLQQCCPSDRVHAFFQELIAKVDAEVDFSQIDAVYAIAPEGAGAHMSILLWRRWPGAGIVADGHELLNGVVGNGNFRSADAAYLLAHDAVTHETGHMLGLSDQYGRVCPTCVDTHDWVGVWSMMDTSHPPSAEFLGWDKWILHWLDATQIRGVTSAGQSVEEVVSPLEEAGGVKLIVVPINDSFLYTVEVRQPIGQDALLCNHGVLVYTVDGSKMNANGTIRMQPAHTGIPCGPISDAAYDIGPGEVATFEDAVVKVELLQAFPDGAYRVRVTRK